jgi:hypothetical protein
MWPKIINYKWRCILHIVNTHLFLCTEFQWMKFVFVLIYSHGTPRGTQPLCAYSFNRELGTGKYYDLLNAWYFLFVMNDFFFIEKMRVKFLNFIIVHKDSSSEFRTHDLPHRGCCLLSLDQRLVLDECYCWPDFDH